MGLKPTYGRVSRYGLVAFASSLDQVGPLARDVTDCALLLEAIAGHDPLDATSSERPVPAYRRALGRGVEGLRIGVPREYLVEGTQAEVAAAVEAALDVCAARREILEVSFRTPVRAAHLLSPGPAEASNGPLRRGALRYSHPEVREMWIRSTARGAFGPEVKRRIMLGTYALSAGYYDAYYSPQQVRTLIKGDFDRASSCDVLVAPTTPTTAFRLGEKTADP